MQQSIFSALFDIALGMGILYLYGYREGTARILSSILLIIAVIMIFAGGQTLMDVFSGVAEKNLHHMMVPLKKEVLHTTL